MSPGGWVTCCMFAHALCATTALEHLEKDSRKSSRKKESITRTTERDAGRRTTHLHPASALQSPPQQQHVGHDFIKERLYYCFSSQQLPHHTAIIARLNTGNHKL